MISGSVEQAAERLRKAVPIMVKHQIPVTPINYALWYTYVSNEDPTLNQRIDEIVSAYGMIPSPRPRTSSANTSHPPATSKPPSTG